MEKNSLYLKYSIKFSKVSIVNNIEKIYKGNDLQNLSMGISLA